MFFRVLLDSVFFFGFRIRELPCALKIPYSSLPCMYVCSSVCSLASVFLGFRVLFSSVFLSFRVS